MEQTTVVLPAAGFGTRMGAPNAKEILINPNTGAPFIDFALTSAVLIQAKIVVLLRPEKTELINYLQAWKEKNKNVKIDVIEIAKTQDWPDTLLLSKPYWSYKNIVCLPDTDWSPCNVISFIDNSLNTVETAYGVFRTSGLNWGFVKSEEKTLTIVEKPKSWSDIDPMFFAWGLMGFRNQMGYELIHAHRDSNLNKQPIQIELTSNLILLDQFNDRTRGES